LATVASYARKSSPSRIYGASGAVRADAGADAEGLADFNQALNLRPDEASGYEGQARVRLLQDSTEIADYRESLRFAPGTTPPVPAVTAPPTGLSEDVAVRFA
jgi:hypothetical protein